MIPECGCNRDDCGECHARKLIDTLDCSPRLCESYGHRSGTKPEDCLGCATQIIVDLRTQLAACQREKEAADKRIYDCGMILCCVNDIEGNLLEDLIKGNLIMLSGYAESERRMLALLRRCQVALLNSAWYTLQGDIHTALAKHPAEGEKEPL